MSNLIFLKLIGILVLVILLVKAPIYGPIWDSQALPHVGSRVVFHDGSEFTGSLSRAWNRNWVLILSNEKSIEFSAFKRLELPPFNPHEEYLTKHWRRYFPVAIIMSLLMGFLLSLSHDVFRRSSHLFSRSSQ